MTVFIHSSALASAEINWPFVLWENLFAAGVLSSPNGFHASFPNALGPQTYDLWEPVGDVHSSLQVILPVARKADCLAIIGHNLGTAGGGMRLQYSVDGINWTTFGPIYYPTDNRVAAIRFAPIEAMGFRLLLNRPSGVELLKVSVAFIGETLPLSETVLAPYVPIYSTQKVENLSAVSMGGHFVGATAYAGELQADLAFMPAKTSRLALPAFEGFRRHYDAGNPFIFAAGAQSLPEEIAYLWRAPGSEELRPAIRGGGAWADLKMKVAGYGG